MNSLGNPATLVAPPEYTELPLCVHSIPCTRSGPFIRRTTHYAWFAVAPTPLATETPEESEVALMDEYRAEMGG